MKIRLKHIEVKKELLQDPEVLTAYNELAEEYQLINEMIHARKRTGMSQTKVAEIMNTTTSAVSRLESLHLKDHPSPSFATLKKYAHALGYKLSIKFIPKDFAKNIHGE